MCSQTKLDWEHQYRIIPSKYLPINFFENLVEADLMEEILYIESLTNDRLRDEVGEITLVAPQDRISGVGSSPVMAAFTHFSKASPSRFSNGGFGVYYAAESIATAIEETKFHRERFLRFTREEPGEIDMRLYIGEIAKPMHDIRVGHDDLQNPDTDTWHVPQAFGQEMWMKKSWGIVYRSVRNAGGECIAALRPPAVTIPRQVQHLSYAWDGSRITNVYEKRLLA